MHHLVIGVCFSSMSGDPLVTIESEYFEYDAEKEDYKFNLLLNNL